MKLGMAAAMALIAGYCSAQTAQTAEVFSDSQIKNELTTMTQQTSAGSSGSFTFGDYGTHAIRLSERTASGGAEVHAHFADIMLVMGGHATLITGGELIGAKPGGNGESSGSGIRNGRSQSVLTGDIIHIPAGVPHQLIIAPGSTYSAVVIKVKE